MPGKQKHELIQLTAGATGATGPVGVAVNMVVIEGSIAFATTSTFWTPSYVYTVVKGSVWEATGDFAYANDSTWISITLTNFLLTTTRNYTAQIQITDVQQTGAAVWPTNLMSVLDIEIVEKSDDKIRFRIIHKPTGQPEPDGARIATAGQGYDIESLKFTLLIIAAD